MIYKLCFPLIVSPWRISFICVNVMYIIYIASFIFFISAIGAVIIRLLVLIALYLVVKNFGRGLKFRGNINLQINEK